MNRVQIFITHYVTEDLIDINDILVEEIQYLEYITKYPHSTTVVYYDEGDAASELYDRLPKGVKLVRNDRPGRNDIQPSLRNKIIDLVDDDYNNEYNNEYFVLLHNDIRVTIGWLDNLVNDISSSEKMYGIGNVVLSPIHIPYHDIGHNGERKENNNFIGRYPDIWSWIQTYKNCLSIDKMKIWCDRQQFQFDGINVYSHARDITDDGHQIMMFMGTKKFFRDIGPCDENFVGTNHDDQDWGIRALLTGKRNLKSQGCMIGHIEGLSFCHPKIENRTSNHKIFIEKWGNDIFSEMQTGQLWIRLHNEQEQFQNKEQ